MGSAPLQAGPRLEPRDETERRFLKNVTRLQVQGEAQGLPDLMRSDWDRLKLEEALWVQERAGKTAVDVVKLGRARAVRAQFNGFARVVSAATKSEEGPQAQPAPTPPQQEKAPSPSPAPSLDQISRDEAVEESPFMKKLRARAFELATMSREREREQDRD
ncbi:MAG: hypothetical protein B7Z29_07535 [Hyphomicrobium sp. 12-62-95]|nr:MAG: hypothetical protein B7Z29_07535 [Hyphomicrobium sp. 12-62-95]